jgi:hypothetical protein
METKKKAERTASSARREEEFGLSGVKRQE